MSYKFNFVTKKIYRDNTEKIIIKNGYLPNQDKIKKAKRIKQIKKQSDLEKIEKSGQLSFDSLENEKTLREEFERKYSPKLENAIRSMNRSKNNIMDILICNEFNFFVTLTFNKNKIDRYNDIETQKAFKQWANYLKKQFSNLIYIAIPEYHEKGGLHYHLLIGNITSGELDLQDSGKRVKSGRTKGQPIFNITKWKYGFSTATEILDNEAVKYYLSKYLTKGKADPRFYGKKRFFTSQNIVRPEIEKYKFRIEKGFNIFDSIIKEDYNIDYEDISKEYTVLSTKKEKG